jgi:hypothetical protein
MMNKSQRIGWRNLSFLRPRKTAHCNAHNKCQLGFEPLEDRRLLADTLGLVWANRNITSGPLDNNIEDTFGPNAAAAYAVIDAAFNGWRQVFTNFNQDGGNNQIDINLRMSLAGANFGGSGGVFSLIGNKPRQGFVDVGRGQDGPDVDVDVTGDGIPDVVGDGLGWFLDPTPNDYSEFGGSGQIINAFAALPTPGGPAAGQADLFSVVVVELAHALGMAQNPGLAWVNTPFLVNLSTPENPVPDIRDSPGTLWVFDGPALGDGPFLVTTNNGGQGGVDTGYPVHVAYPPNAATYLGETIPGVADCGSAGGDGSIRYLPSQLMTEMLSTIYGYSGKRPEQFGTFYAMQRTDGSLLIRGAPGVSDDAITVTESGGILEVKVDLGVDVPGVLGPFVSKFQTPSVSSIRIESGAGSDTIKITSLDWNHEIPITVVGGSGADSMSVEDGFYGDGGPSTLNLYADRMERLTSTALGLHINPVYFSEVEEVSYQGANNTAGYIILETSSLVSNTTVRTSQFGDAINVYPRDSSGAPSIRSNIAIFGGGGPDFINIDDHFSTSGAVWSIYNPFDTPGNVQWQSFKVAGGGFISSNKDIEKTNLYGSQGADNFNFSSYLNGSELRVDSGGGDDTFNMGVSTPEGTVTADLDAFFKPLPFFEYKSGSGQDTFNIANGNNPSGWIYARTNSSVLAQENVVGGYFANFTSDAENVTIGGRGDKADIFHVDESPANSVTTLFGGLGDGRDTYRLGTDAAGADGILGLVAISASAGNDTVIVNDMAETTNASVHVDGSQVGAHPGDHDLFGPGGRLEFDGLTAEVVVQLGAGLDLVYAKPSVTKTLILQGNNPTTPNGDELQLNLAGMINPVIGPDPILANATRYTFDNAAPVTYVGFETVVTAQNLPGDYDGNGVVGQEDYAIWKANFGATSPPAAGDGNADGIVDTADYVLWRNNLGATFPAAAVGAAILEADSNPLAAMSATAEATPSTAAAAALSTVENFNGNKRLSQNDRGLAHFKKRLQGNMPVPLSVANRNTHLRDIAYARFADGGDRSQTTAFSFEGSGTHPERDHIAIGAWDKVFRDLVSDLRLWSG